MLKRATLTSIWVAMVLCTLSCTDKKEDEWVSLFNGKDLTGWTPKITGYPAGENYGNTFRVEDGLLTVGYEKYARFENRFGHLFYEKPLSNYILRVEYRFIGEQATGGAAWATRNSGVMFHSQSPETMGEQQDFPISLEAQFLGGLGEGPRPTGSLCTPGTHVDIDGKLEINHCITSTAKTYDGDQWVTMDIVARADGRIAHVIEGDTVMQYTNPVMGGGNVSNLQEGVMQEGKPLNSGYFALQSESHPIQFRKVLLKQLD
ncbi:3-keto-disaccharide hydrolase [Roseivirga pacifica]|uniref:3-keto-disaccharide hydrolase n=1 Tax=Roseivirga pacifica TaxID=1267423 RepID=UPI00227B7DE3|nr:DUF1080 domain-containing protein [Roseivirga pacifica]